MNLHWIFFIVVPLCLFIDLFIVNRKAHEINFKESLIWSFIWIAVAIGYGIFVMQTDGVEKGNLWFTAYVIEKTLSVDNLFVIYIIFQYFDTPPHLHHRILFWGIIGAIVFRGIFIVIGASIVALFHPILYVFGAILIYTAIKILFTPEKDPDIKENAIVKFFSNNFRVIRRYEGTSFFITKRHKCKGKRPSVKYFATLSFIVLLMIETTDIIFAIDSIPAAFGVTSDIYILYTSNIFAVLGLRALYFVLQNAIEKLWALKYGVGLILGFIGVKMVFEWLFIIPSNISLIVVLSLLSLSLLFSFILKPKEND